MAKKGLSSYQEAAILLLTTHGADSVDIANETGVDLVTVQALQRSPAFSSALGVSLLNRLSLEGAPAAVNLLIDIVASRRGTATEQIRAANTVLELSGMSQLGAIANANTAPDNKKALLELQVSAMKELGQAD